MRWLRFACQPAALYFISAAIVLAILIQRDTNEVMTSWLADQSPWFRLAFIVPIIIGFLLMLQTRRLWTWPFAYLVVLWLVPATPTQDLVDVGVLATNALLLMLAITFAESLGLSLGRWFSRILAMGYFAAAGCCLLALSLARLFGPGRSWQVWFFVISGVLYLAQAWIQYARHSSRPVELGEDLPTPPTPVSGAHHLPWTIRVDARKPPQDPRQQGDPPVGDNQRNRVR